MKAWSKLLLGISLSFMCIFTSLGYAGVSTQLKVQGVAEAQPTYAVFITSITTSSTSGASSVVNKYINTIMDVGVNLGQDSASTETMSITVYNNTTDYYTFKGVLYTEGEHTYDNTNIIFDVSGIDIGYKLAPKQSVTLNITFKYKAYQQNPESLSAILDVHFGLAGEDEGTDYEDYILAFLSNDKGYGLNNTDKKGLEVLSNIDTYNLLFADDNIKGGNLKHLIEAVNSSQTENLTFVYQYLNDSEIVLYTYEEKYNDAEYANQSITLYKTVFSRETVGSQSYTKWEIASQVKGTATVKRITTPAGTTIYAIDINTWQKTQLN